MSNSVFSDSCHRILSQKFPVSLPVCLTLSLPVSPFLHLSLSLSSTLSSLKCDIIFSLYSSPFLFSSLFSSSLLLFSLHFTTFLVSLFSLLSLPHLLLSSQSSLLSTFLLFFFYISHLWTSQLHQLPSSTNSSLQSYPNNKLDGLLSVYTPAQPEEPARDGSPQKNSNGT